MTQKSLTYYTIEFLQVSSLGSTIVLCLLSYKEFLWDFGSANMFYFGVNVVVIGFDNRSHIGIKKRVSYLHRTAQLHTLA